MDAAFLSSSYAYDDYFEPNLAVLPIPCGFQQPQHGHLYPILPSTLHPIHGTTHATGSDQYDHSITTQPSMFYYAATTASAGPSLVSHQDTTQSNLQDEQAINDGNGSTALENRKRGTKRGRPTKNPVWTFFRRIDDKSVQCNMCARLVKSACATNMSKHLERHHHNTVTATAPTVSELEFATPKFNDPNRGEYIQQTAPAWNAYQQQLQPLKVVTTYDHYQTEPTSQRALTGVPWNPDRRGAKRNRRTKHPVWELFQRTTDGNAQCVLCSVVVRSPCSSNFMGHLNRHHSEHYQEIYNRWLEGRVDMPSLPS